MWRPRKDSIYRPPTAAESAASADALEGFRRQASQPQDKAPIGQTVLVKTPEDGIPARDENTIFWVKCQRCIERYTADEKEIVETDEEIIVHNLFLEAVAGDTYVPTSLTEGGTRYASQADGVIAFTLTEDMDNTTDGEASVTMHKTWDATTEAYTGSEAGVVLSIGGAFDDALSGAYGEGRIRPGNDRLVIDPIWIAC